MGGRALGPALAPTRAPLCGSMWSFPGCSRATRSCFFFFRFHSSVFHGGMEESSMYFIPCTSSLIPFSSFCFFCSHSSFFRFHSSSGSHSPFSFIHSSLILLARALGHSFFPMYSALI